jgi:hypothetical protein
MLTLLMHSTAAIEKEVEALAKHIQAPKAVDLHGVPAFRHDQHDDLLMSYLKCVRGVSLLHAGIVLSGYGDFQEVGILCRCLSEAAEDVMFLATPLGENKTPSKHQRQLVEEFFQEEFGDPSKPAAGQAVRNRVSRDTVLAGIARIEGNPLNPSDSKAFQQLLHKGYSGYVHGAYIHTMELFGAPPNAEGKPDAGTGKFYMRGGMPPARTDEMVEALESRAELLAVAVSVVAKRVGQGGIVDALRPVIEALATSTGTVSSNLNEAAKAVKAGRPIP